MRAFRLLHERPHVRERVAAALPARARGRVPGHELRPGDAAAAARGGAPQRDRRGGRRPGDLPLPRRVAEEPRSTSSASSPTRRSSGWSATTAPGGASSTRRAPWWRRSRPDRQGADGRERRARALLALPLRARPGPGRGRRGRAADRRTACRPRRSACWCARCKSEGAVVASALEERAVPVPLVGSAAYFQRAEVRDVLAWLRALADPGDSGAVVRALSRPPIELRSVDVARLTQLARRRKLDMPLGRRRGAGGAAALAGGPRPGARVPAALPLRRRAPSRTAARTLRACG